MVYSHLTTPAMQLKSVDIRNALRDEIGGRLAPIDVFLCGNAEMVKRAMTGVVQKFDVSKVVVALQVRESQPC